MTLQDWLAEPSLAAELKEILQHPTLIKALSIVEGQSMAKTVGTSQLIKLADKATALFGYDAGRYSIIEDLHNLSTPPNEVEELEATYTDEPNEK